MSVSPLRAWLRRQPHASKLVADGREIAIHPGRRRWEIAEQTIQELGASRLEALDDEGRVLRVCELSELGDDAAPDRPPPPKMQTPHGEIASLILEATDRGAARHAEAYALAFDKMTTIVELSLERLTALEIAWQRALDDRAAAGADSRESSVEAGLVNMMAHAATQPRRPRPNGAKKND